MERNDEWKIQIEHEKHDRLIDKIKDTISPYFKNIYIEGEEGVGKIQVFDKVELIKGEKDRYRIAESDILVCDDNNKPLLIIEPEIGSSPKTFGRSIPIYAIAKKIQIIKKPDFIIESPLLLLIVIPNQPKDGQKSEQLSDLEVKLKEIINLNKSSLKDFAICQIDDLKTTLKRLFVNTIYNRPFA